MIGLIFTVGVLLLILCIVCIALSFAPLREKDEIETYKDIYERERTRTTTPASPAILLQLAGIKKGILAGVVGALLIIFSNTLFYAEQGYFYLLIKPSGTKDAIMTEGFHFKGFFSKIKPWQADIDIKAGDKASMSDEVEGKMDSVSIRFLDNVTAKMAFSVRFALPRDKDEFIKFTNKFRSMANLVDNTLVPTVNEQAIQTGYMYSAQDYLSGEAQSFRQTFDEMLKDGTYKVRKIVYKDTSYADEISDISKKRLIRDIATRYVVEKVIKNGIAERIPNEISSNGIRISQVIVDQITPDPDYQVRLKEQKDESAKRSLKQSQIETAKIDQLRIRAEGERNKEQERAIQEKIAVKKLIAIETSLKEEETNKQLAKIQLETTEINALKTKVKADADAYEISKKVKAGITPETRLKMTLDAQVKVAEYQSKIVWPTTYINGGGGKGNSADIMDLMMLQQMKGINVK